MKIETIGKPGNGNSGFLARYRTVDIFIYEKNMTSARLKALETLHIKDTDDLKVTLMEDRYGAPVI